MTWSLHSTQLAAPCQYRWPPGGSPKGAVPLPALQLQTTPPSPTDGTFTSSRRPGRCRTCWRTAASRGSCAGSRGRSGCTSPRRTCCPRRRRSSRAPSGCSSPPGRTPMAACCNEEKRWLTGSDKRRRGIIRLEKTGVNFLYKKKTCNGICSKRATMSNFKAKNTDGRTGDDKDLVKAQDSRLTKVGIEHEHWERASMGESQAREIDLVSRWGMWCFSEGRACWENSEKSASENSASVLCYSFSAVTRSTLYWHM